MIGCSCQVKKTGKTKEEGCVEGEHAGGRSKERFST